MATNRTQVSGIVVASAADHELIKYSKTASAAPMAAGSCCWLCDGRWLVTTFCRHFGAANVYAMSRRGSDDGAMVSMAMMMMMMVMQLKCFCSHVFPPAGRPRFGAGRSNVIVYAGDQHWRLIVKAYHAVGDNVSSGRQRPLVTDVSQRRPPHRVARERLRLERSTTGLDV
jgi:hypothetical protein